MAYIVGTGSYLPGKEPVTNKMLSEIFGDSVALIGDYFGVNSRYFSVDYCTGENIEQQCNSDFCCMAVKSALHGSKITAKDVGLLIVATNTPDYALPQMSAMIQQAVGFRDIITLDLRGGCSVPLQAILIAESFIKSGIVENAVVVGAEAFSNIYYPILLKNRRDYLVKDLMSSLIFGDGAGAIVMSKNKVSDHSLMIEKTVSQSSFAQWPSGFVVALGGSKVRQLGDVKLLLGEMIKHYPKQIGTYLPKVTQQVFEKIYSENKYHPGDFRFIVGPQASQRLVGALNDKFRINNYFYCGDVTGNVPAGALLIALDKLFRNSVLAVNDKVLIMGIESPKWIYGYSILAKV